MFGIRISTLLLAQTLGALVGGLLTLPWDVSVTGALLGVLSGACVGAWLWLWWDSRRAQKLWAWLKSGELVASPAVGGIWGMLTAATRRWLRTGEQSAEAARQRMQGILAALQASPNGLILLHRGHIEWCNLTAEQFFGLDLPRDVQQSIGNLVRDPVFNAYWQAGDFGHPIQMQGRNHTPERPVVLSVQIHPYGEEKHLMLARDVTALEQAEGMRRDFVANVSHEIRTPLTVLSGFVETLQKLELTADERQHYLGMMARQADRMTNLVQDLLTLSRLEGLPPPGLEHWVSVQSLLHLCEVEAAALATVLAREGDGTIHTLYFPRQDAPGMQWEIAGAQAELMSAFSNLINNALRYTPPDGRVDVHWELLPDGRAQFSVKDTGPGIAPMHIHRLTERFYRVDRSRSRETGGTGLGLAIVKQALQRHGAELHIDSTPGDGATFSAIFPASRLRRRGVKGPGELSPSPPPSMTLRH